jgi:hypothetical protein
VQGLQRPADEAIDPNEPVYCYCRKVRSCPLPAIHVERLYAEPDHLVCSFDGYGHSSEEWDQGAAFILLHRVM